MYSKFQDYILEEIDEVGDYSFILLIPYFREIILNQKIIDFGKGIGAYVKNYEISQENFEKLQKEIQQLFKDFNLGIFKYLKEVTSYSWEDSHQLLTEEETEKYLSNKENWIWHPGMQGHFIAEKEESDKVEEYVRGLYE